MKRTLSDVSNDNAYEPPAKRQKLNPTPPLSDPDDQEPPTIVKVSTTASNASIEDNECCICFNVIDFPIKLDCGHVFCFLCVKEIRLQSSNTFNMANFINNPKQSMDNTGTSETFSCPYCRREYDVKLIDRATMKRTDWMQDTKEERQEEEKEIITWQYSGKSGGWWAYKHGHNQELERGYEKFLKQLKNEHEKEEKEQHKLDTKYGWIGDGEEDEDSDLAKEIGLLCHECVIEIGVRKYVIDFAQMMQFDHANPTRKRRVRRQRTTKQKLKRSDSLKGCAGKMFDDKNHNTNDKHHA